jgi:hypothetical protein
MSLHTPLIFDDAFLKSLDGPGAAFERGKIVRTAKYKGAQEFRDRLELAVADYPQLRRDALIGRIRSLGDVESLSAISELLVYDNLRREFGEVEVERPFECVGGKTPDFFVPSSNLVVEVATLFETPDPNLAAIIETANTLSSTTKILMFCARRLPPDENPRLSEVRDALSPILADYDGTRAMESFWCRTPQGIELSGVLIKGKIEHPVVAGTYGARGFGGDDSYNSTIRRNVLKAKVKKYRGLAGEGIRLILALYSQNSWLDEDDFDAILFGDEEYIDTEGEGLRCLRKNAFITPDHNCALSGVLIYSPRFDSNWYLVPNRFAAVPLGDASVPLQRAFGAKEVRSPADVLANSGKGPAEQGVAPDDRSPSAPARR